MIRVKTRHDEDFDIHTSFIDPAMSPHARHHPDYVAKITAFYRQLGITCAIWTTPESEELFFETKKPIEYILEIESNRAVAYVDESTWSPYLRGERDSFDFSEKPRKFAITSILVEPPISEAEKKIRRRLRRKNHRGEFEVIEEETY